MANSIRCGGGSGATDSGAAYNMYRALAQIVACGGFNLKSVEVKQTALLRALPKTNENCLVSIDNVNAYNGSGKFTFKDENAQPIEGQWNNHDLDGKKSSVEFWRDQFESSLKRPPPSEAAHAPLPFRPKSLDR